ncbi:MAG: hypothetical protein EAS52_13545 [Parapedobacter sp.]|nr:MAG: hypothetical protein EAS52_13545 [Parapedobacter sp.]
MLADEAKALGADGIINLKIEYIPSYSPTISIRMTAILPRVWQLNKFYINHEFKTITIFW